MADFGADGTVVHTTDLNKILKIVGIAAYAGQTPPAVGASSGFQGQVFTATVSSNGSGDCTATYPTAFPNGSMAIVMPASIGAFFAPIINDGTIPTASAVAFRIYDGAGAPRTSFGPVRVVVIAIGW